MERGKRGETCMTRSLNHVIPLPWHSGSCDRAFKSGRITEINSPESFVSSSLLQWEGEEKKSEQSARSSKDGCLLNSLVHILN